MRGVLLGALVALLCMAGCAPPSYWKPGWTAEQFTQDQFDCEQKVIVMMGGYAQMGIGDAIFARSNIQRCLESRGYRVQESGSAGK